MNVATCLCIYVYMYVILFLSSLPVAPSHFEGQSRQGFRLVSRIWGKLFAVKAQKHCLSSDPTNIGFSNLLACIHNTCILCYFKWMDILIHRGRCQSEFIHHTNIATCIYIISGTQEVFLQRSPWFGLGLWRPTASDTATDLFIQPLGHCHNHHHQQWRNTSDTARLNSYQQQPLPATGCPNSHCSYDRCCTVRSMGSSGSKYR